MRFRVHYRLPTRDGFGNFHEDSVVVSGDTVEDVREAANRELEKRGGLDPWSEEL